jgi:predicted dehydrogenase
MPSAKMTKTGDYNVAIIGMGSQGYNTWFKLLRKGSTISISAVCDSNIAVIDSFISRHPDVPAYTDLAELLKQHAIDFAVVCAPNKYHVSMIEQLAAAGVPCLKEKPVADSLVEFHRLCRIPTKIGVTFQRRWQPRFVHFRNLLPMIGKPLSVRATLSGAYDPPQNGWRVMHSIGTFVSLIHPTVLVDPIITFLQDDLGVHMLDAIVWLFGRPSTVYSLRVDDAPLPARDRESHIAITWTDLVGHLYVSEVAFQKEESVIVRGEQGSLHLNGNKITHFTVDGRETFQISFQTCKEDTLLALCEEFGRFVMDEATSFTASIEQLEDSFVTVMAIRDSFFSKKLEIVPRAKQNGVAHHALLLEARDSAIDLHTSCNVETRDVENGRVENGRVENGRVGNGNSINQLHHENGIESIKPIQFVLNTGDKIPALGYGTRKPKQPDQVYVAVTRALAAGYRHIDSASRYNNEDQVGRAVRESGIPRREVWITTKVDNSSHHRVAESVSSSLAKLEMDYVDLLLMASHSI